MSDIQVAEEYWTQVAADLEKTMWDNLSRDEPKYWGAIRNPGAPSRHYVVVLQRGPGTELDKQQVRDVLKESGVLPTDVLDIYRIVDHHWSQCGPHDLNPDDEENGLQDQIFLQNLKPDFVIASETGDIDPQIGGVVIVP